MHEKLLRGCICLCISAIGDQREDTEQNAEQGIDDQQRMLSAADFDDSGRDAPDRTCRRKGMEQEQRARCGLMLSLCSEEQEQSGEQRENKCINHVYGEYAEAEMLIDSAEERQEERTAEACRRVLQDQLSARINIRCIQCHSRSFP